MLNLSKLSTLCWRLSLLAFIGPAVVKAQSATVLAEAGCSAFFYWNGQSMIYQWVCDDHPATASPEAYVYGKFHYLVDVLSGFPVDTTSKKTRPEFRETYKWTNKDLVTVGRDNCLYANMEIPGGFYVKHILGDQVGVCPPSKYDLEERELFQNPYYMREEARKEAAANSQTTTLDFVADNAGMPNIPDPVNIPVGFSAEGSLPQSVDEVAFGTMDFLSTDFPSGDT